MLRLEAGGRRLTEERPSLRLLAFAGQRGEVEVKDPRHPPPPEDLQRREVLRGHVLLARSQEALLELLAGESATEDGPIRARVDHRQVAEVKGLDRAVFSPHLDLGG